MISDARLNAAKEGLPWPSRVDLDGWLWPHVAAAVLTEADTNSLIDYLRNGGHVGPEQKAFIADVLAGKIRARPAKRLPIYQFGREALREHISQYAHLILGDRIHVDGDWDAAYDAVQLEVLAIQGALAKLKIPVPITSRGHATTAAKHILCAKLAPTTLSQLDEYLSVRSARRRSV